MGAPNNTRKLTILAQDPAVRLAGRLAFESVEVPNEVLADGPTGYRVKVIDFDVSANVLYAPRRYGADEASQDTDPFAPKEKQTAAARRKWEAKTLADPAFHSQNVYAIVMRTLARFEFALGRRVAWGFAGHQISVAPHAFCDANAYYSEQDRALLFGYFTSPRTNKPVFTCLSHDIVAHETTHALLDGIRDGFTEPSSPDQAAFHEGFADVVALLSVFSLPTIVEAALVARGRLPRPSGHVRLVPKSAVTLQALIDSLLLGMGEQFGLETEGARANALRRSAALAPSRRYLGSRDYQEEHDRGEVFSAAMLRTFLALWTQRIDALGTFRGNQLNLDSVVEEGTRAAENLLTMAIRALDYCPPVDLTFGDYLAALLTADAQTIPDDSRYRYRDLVHATFASYGIDPPHDDADPSTGQWPPFDDSIAITYHRTHYESMLHSEEEVFRFVWENRAALGLNEGAYTRVTSVRSSLRQGQDGFVLRETICEYVQELHIFAAEVEATLGIERPPDMPTTQALTAFGGGTLVFDEYGRIKYHVAQRLGNGARQSARLAYLWTHGFLSGEQRARSRFASIHRRRVM